MSNLIFNLRIGKLHIQVTREWRLRLAINEYHRWLRWPIIKLHQFGMWTPQ
jgi:hypothetical protein